jgi:hypothetical protein
LRAGALGAGVVQCQPPWWWCQRCRHSRHRPSGSP